MSDQVAISVSNVSKSFKLPHEKQSSVKGVIINAFRKGDRSYEVQQVLEDISFEVQKGEFFGIVGRNGSGKSTMLKLLAGIYTQDAGDIRINGSLTPFIELGVGFNQELTGRENVFLNGSLLGFNRAEMLAMYDEIVQFSELERFMDQKLKNYSSGMQVRLAFSIAIKAQSDVLLIDEVLAVGDAAFQKKCYDYFMKLKRDKKTVILVTHDMSAVRLYCDSAIMIDQGKIVQSGKIEKVAQAYQRLFNNEIAETVQGEPDDEKRWGTGKLRAGKVDVRVTKEDITVSVNYTCQSPIDAPVLGFNIYSPRGMNLLEGNTIREKIETRPLKAGEQATISWSFPNVLSSDTYHVSVSSCNQGVTEFYDWYNEAATFIVPKEGSTAAFIDPPLTVGKVIYS
jgi:ABC-2 type transport system ATP-binding protein